MLHDKLGYGSNYCLNSFMTDNNYLSRFILKKIYLYLESPNPNSSASFWFGSEIASEQVHMSEQTEQQVQREHQQAFFTVQSKFAQSLSSVFGEYSTKGFLSSNKAFNPALYIVLNLDIRYSVLNAILCYLRHSVPRIICLIFDSGALRPAYY